MERRAKLTAAACYAPRPERRRFPHLQRWPFLDGQNAGDIGRRLARVAALESGGVGRDGHAVTRRPNGTCSDDAARLETRMTRRFARDGIWCVDVPVLREIELGGRSIIMDRRGAGEPLCLSGVHSLQSWSAGTGGVSKCIIPIPKGLERGTKHVAHSQALRARPHAVVRKTLEYASMETKRPPHPADG